MTHTPQLSDTAVADLLNTCLAPADVGQHVPMPGAVYSLDVKGKEEDIKRLLQQLPKEFWGVGHSMMASMFNKDWKIWASSLIVGQHLLAMGMAAGFVTEAFPASMRELLPEKVPYYRIEV